MTVREGPSTHRRIFLGRPRPRSRCEPAFRPSAVSACGPRKGDDRKTVMSGCLKADKKT
jgi:hypothetical protein